MHAFLETIDLSTVNIGKDHKKVLNISLEGESAYYKKKVFI